MKNKFVLNLKIFSIIEFIIIFEYMRLTFFLFIFLSFFCSFGQNPKEYVYEKERLLVLKEDTTLFGVITYVHGELDGDYHLRLRMIHKYDSLLVKNNFKKQDSCLVVEIVCGKGSFQTICNGYKNCLRIPNVGDYVKVNGPYVFDKRHKWTEIHPALSIITIKDIADK